MYKEMKTMYRLKQHDNVIDQQVATITIRPLYSTTSIIAHKYHHITAPNHNNLSMNWYVDVLGMYKQYVQVMSICCILMVCVNIYHFVPPLQPSYKCLPCFLYEGVLLYLKECLLVQYTIIFAFTFVFDVDFPQKVVCFGLQEGPHYASPFNSL